MIETAALAIVAATAVYFLALAAASLFAPARTGAFLIAFASSPAKHYAELAVRLLVGAAFLLSAPQVPAPAGFTLLGGLLVVSTGVLLFLPWHWHRRFAQRTVPGAIRFLALFGVASAALGLFVLWAAWRGLAG